VEARLVSVQARPLRVQRVGRRPGRRLGLCRGDEGESVVGLVLDREHFAQGTRDRIAVGYGFLEEIGGPFVLLTAPALARGCTTNGVGGRNSSEHGGSGGDVGPRSEVLGADNKLGHQEI
jgi:hypothetical protein